MANIIGVTACPTGIAHTFMAAEGLQRGAEALGHTIKVETQGSVGTQNALTPADIAAADVVIIAADAKVDLSRFANKPLYETSTNAAINNGQGVIQQALAQAGNYSTPVATSVATPTIPTSSNRIGYLQLNPHGVIGLLSIIVMFGVAFALSWNINWWYFVIALVFYSVAVLSLTGMEDTIRRTIQSTGHQTSRYVSSPAYSPSPTDGKKLNLDQSYIFRWLLGCHLALVFLAAGLLIRFPDRALIDWNLDSILFIVGGAIFLLYLTWSISASLKADGRSVGSVVAIIGIVEFISVTILATLGVRGGYFVAGVIGGLALPFLLLRIVQDKNRMDLHGIIGMILIILMFGIALLYDWNISWGYFIFAIALYAGAIIFLKLVEDSPGQGPAPELFKPRLGCHLAFIFLMAGLVLHFQNGWINLGFFIASVAGGIVIPYLLFR